MKLKLILFNLIIILNNFWTEVESNTIGVPVLLWSKSSEDLINRNNNRLLPSISSQSSVNQISSDVLRDDYLKSQTILAFIQNHLSVEQFSAEEKKFKTIKDIISDQTLEPLLLTDVLNPLEAIKDFTVQDINHLNINNGQKVVINLPKDSLVENDKLIGELIAKSGQNVTKNVLYIISGRQNSYDNAIEENHLFLRHILEADQVLNERNDSLDIEKLITIKEKNKDCLYFFSSSVTVSFYNASLANSSLLIGSFDEKPSLGNGSKCWEASAQNLTQESPAILELTYKNSTETYPTLKLTLTIDSPYNNNKNITYNQIDFWRISKGEAVVTVNDTFEEKYHLRVADIESDVTFSYSCSYLNIYSNLTEKNETNNNITQIRLLFRNFQLQPFANPHNSNDSNAKYYIFAESFDCQQWMTLPLWMGLIVLLMLLSITFMGIYFLMEVKTPDRFENPKGKPLQISNADE